MFFFDFFVCFFSSPNKDFLFLGSGLPGHDLAARLFSPGCTIWMPADGGQHASPAAPSAPSLCPSVELQSRATTATWPKCAAKMYNYSCSYFSPHHVPPAVGYGFLASSVWKKTSGWTLVRTWTYSLLADGRQNCNISTAQGGGGSFQR